MFTNPIINRVIIGSVAGFVAGHITSRFMKIEPNIEIIPPTDFTVNIIKIDKENRERVAELDREIMSDPVVAYYLNPDIPMEEKLERLKKTHKATEK